jgi:hypothetical protein
VEILVVWFVFAIIGAVIGAAKGNTGAGLILGALLGPLGWLIMAVQRTSKLSQLQSRPESEGWHPDPLGRFDSRYYDGKRWTQHVGRVEQDGTRRQLEDPV